MNFTSQVLIHPGLNNSGEMHWQTLWEKRYPNFTRVQQKEWDHPVCSEWIKTLDEIVMSHDPANVVIVAHSLACATVVFWTKQYNRKIKGALLVAPSDTEADSYPSGTTGFTPMPLIKLPFPSITVASTNDTYVKIDRAKALASSWGSEFVTIGNAGHINADSKLGFWEFGLELLDRLDRC
jgi:predicted alpha/beta hydrolase family esterase